MFRCFQVYIAINRIDNVVLLDVRTRFVLCTFIHSKNDVVNFNVSNAKLMHMLNFLDTFSVDVIVPIPISASSQLFFWYSQQMIGFDSPYSPNVLAVVKNLSCNWINLNIAVSLLFVVIDYGWKTF